VSKRATELPSSDITTRLSVPPTPLRGALRLAEAAVYLGTNRTAVYQLVRSGACTSFHLGRIHLISIKELDRLIAEREEAER
jgi:excisionase family DNA binding protein